MAYFGAGSWMGNFKNGQPNGEGVFIYSDGKKVKGNWVDGILQE